MKTGRRGGAIVVQTAVLALSLTATPPFTTYTLPAHTPGELAMTTARAELSREAVAAPAP